MIVRNRLALVYWAFAAVVFLFTATMTFVTLGGGPGEPDSPILELGVMTLFWFGSLGLLAFAASQPIIRVEWAVGGGLRIESRYPFRCESRQVLLTEIRTVEVVEEADDEGDAHFFARMFLLDGTHVDLHESHDRDRCEGVKERFNEAIG